MPRRWPFLVLTVLASLSPTRVSRSDLRAGVYLYRLTAGAFRDHKKMVIGAR